VGFLGYKLSLFYQSYARIFASIILLLIGLFYLCSELIHKLEHEHLIAHDHHSHDAFSGYNPYAQKKYWMIIVSLAISSFLTPCVELEAYYLTAGIWGWHGILGVSAIYAVITIFLTILLVYFALKGRNKLKFDFLEKYEHQMVGIIMILIGVGIFLFE
jgi:putative Mn2+ efflux pump MntP